MLHSCVLVDKSGERGILAGGGHGGEVGSSDQVYFYSLKDDKSATLTTPTLLQSRSDITLTLILKGGTRLGN